MNDRLPEEEISAPPGADVDLDAKLVAALERVGQALRTQLWQAGGRHGLSPIQVQLLLRLASDPGPRRRVGALAAALDVKHPTVSDALAALVRKRLVEREGARRGAPLALSAQGRALAAELAAWGEPTRRRLAGLPAADKERTLELALRLIAELQADGAIGVARMCTSCRFFRPDAHPGSRRRHHCALVDAPLAPDELRVDCAEHEPRAA